MNGQSKKSLRWLSSALVFLALLILPVNLYSQEIIQTAEGDTLVTITPDHVRIINSVFLDSERLSEKCMVQDEEIQLLENRIAKADTIIRSYSLLVGDMKEEMAKRELLYKNTNVKDKRKAFWLGGIAGIAIGVIATLILAR